MPLITYQQTWARFAYERTLELQFWNRYSETHYLQTLGYEPVIERTYHADSDYIQVEARYWVSGPDAVMLLLKFPVHEEPAEVELIMDDHNMILNIDRHLEKEMNNGENRTAGTL
jgi:hypothetical protein